MAQDPWAVVSQEPIKAQPKANADPWSVVSVEPAPSAPSADLTSNPKGEGLYRMGSYDFQGGQATKPEIQVPYSKVEAAQESGYNLHPDETSRYQKDTAAEGKQPGLIERAGAAVQKAFEPVPHEKLGASILTNEDRAAGRTIAAVPGYFRDLATAANDFIHGRTSGSELADMVDPSKVPENLYKQYQEDKKIDPRMAAQNLVGTLEGLGITAAVTHGAGEVARTAASRAAEAVPEAVRTGVQKMVGAGERAVKEEVTTRAEKANKAAESVEESNRTAEENTNRARGVVDEANKAARLKAKSATTEAERAANAQEPYLEGDTVVHSARSAHDDVVKRQNDVETKRATLTDNLAKARKNVADRVQAINDSARAYFKKNFDDVKAKLDAPDPDTGQPHTTSYADLDADIEDAEGKIKGSRESVRIFQDIAKKAQGIGETEHNAQELAEMSPDERREAMQLPGAVYSDLDGYYQEAGRVIGNPSTAPDVRQAVIKFRESLGKRMQDLADEVDPKVGAQHKLLRAQYKEYAGGYRDATGPKASPVAKGLQAAEAHHATTPYEGLSPEETTRVKGIVTGDTRNPLTQFTEKTIIGPDGKPEPAWRFRKQTHAEINTLRNIQKGLKSLPDTEKLADDVVKSENKLAKARADAREKSAAKIPQKEYGEPEPTTPVEIPELNTRQIREQLLNRWASGEEKLNPFQVRSLIRGGLGPVLGVVLGEHFGGGAGGAVGAVMGTAVGPAMIARIVDMPVVREWLTRPPAGELETLRQVPYADRVKIADTLRATIKQADSAGKPIRIAPAVVTFIAANGRRPTTSGQQVAQ